MDSIHPGMHLLNKADLKFSFKSTGSADVSGESGAVQQSGQPVKREALLTPLIARKPLHLRKKFRYVLY